MDALPPHPIKAAPRSVVARGRGAVIRRSYDWLLRELPVLFLCWGVLSGASIAWTMAPWQNADEPAHMLRMAQISLGGLFGWRIGHSAGGISYPAIVWSAARSEVVKFHPDVRVTRPQMRATEAQPWGRAAPYVFANTAAYPPLLYAAGVPGMLIGRWLGMSVADTLRLVRMFNAIAAACLGAAAIAVARRVRLAVAAVLVLPMSLALAASASQDALMIPAAALAAALVDRARVDAPLGPPRHWILAVLGLCLLAVAAGRPPYLLLSALPLLLPVAQRRAAWWLAGGVAAAVGLWAAHVALQLGYPTLQAQPGAQAWRLFHHPAVFLDVLGRTLAEQGHGFIESTAGVLGWADTPLPPGFLATAAGVLLLAVLSAAVPDADRRRWPRWLAIVAALGSAVAVFLSMYLQWSPLRSPMILGVTGRYFLPLIPALALGMPSLGRAAVVLRPAALLAVLALAAATPAVTTVTLVSRYYLAP